VTASEFAFLALGLLLGIATGAALIEVLRARPPSTREVRVTVAPNSIPRRGSTLAGDAFATGASEPARGGPGDRRWVDRVPASLAGAIAATTAPAGASPESDSIRTPVPVGVGSGPFRLTRRIAGPSPGGLGSGQPGPEMVGLSIAHEADPMLTALRATAAATAAAAMRTQRLRAGSPEVARSATSADQPRSGST
jgi:hypothetical protein